MILKDTLVFLAHTPLQVFFVEKIVEHYNQYNRELILVTSVVPSDSSTFNKVITIPKKNGISKLFKTWKAKRVLLKISKTREASFFISHTSALLDNYVFYSLKQKRPDLSVNFFYDGILYFYDYREKYKRVHSIRKIIGRLVGINYHFEPRIFPFDLINHGMIYTIKSEFTLGDKSKHVEVNFQKKEYNAIKQHTLVLGGKPSLLSAPEIQAIYRKIIDLITLQNTYTHFYKGHHADNSNNFELAKTSDISFIDITQNSPIEEVVEQYNPLKVYSYPSSALINLKAMYGNRIELFAFYIKDKVSDIDKLRPIFKAMDIKLILI